MFKNFTGLSDAEQKRLKKILSRGSKKIEGILIYDMGIDHFCLQPPECTGLIGGKKGLIPLKEGQELTIFLQDTWVPTTIIKNSKNIYELKGFGDNVMLGTFIRIKAE